ncbi:MAG: DJ-1/PfpI family protein, partial [Anaerolineae bacterium]|nr:DJ-1/PfpI family protein [Anaerolineae bacterium]
MIFVLWANNFDEAAASVFITELRDAGLRVQVVGLHGQQIAGAHGLVLGPDVRMDEAQRYGDDARCLIIPAALR